MASNDDVEVDVRRNRRRVRLRKATKTTPTTVDDAVVPNGNADASTGAVEAPDVEPTRQDGSTDPLDAAAVPVLCRQTPTTTINGSVDDSELTVLPRSEIADNGDLGVQPSTGTDDTTLCVRSHPPPDDRPSRPPDGAPKKSRGKRRVKNRDRTAAEMTKDTLTDQQLNGHEISGDWFTAVRSADVATVRRLAQSRTIDVNSTDEVN